MASARRSRTLAGPTSLAADRDEFEKQQVLAVQKAINTQETAAKQKHIRTAILGTHKERGADMFWHVVVNKVPLASHPIIAWKFCHVLHKLMRDGHPNVITDSLKFRSKLTDLGNLWGHLKDGYGSLIKLYTKLLVVKLEFHQRNPKVGGNLQLTNEQLDAIGEQDVNHWFELAVEMLDYLDAVLAVQHDVFGSLDMSRANSLTAQGQCRLAPLISCILDSGCLYDYLVKVLFRLHATLPPDVLSGHRIRFNAQFKQLKQFYYTSSNLQYFKYLISIPPLPEAPPNFLVAADFDSYVTPRVFLHEDGPPDDGAATPPLDFNMPLVDLTVDSAADVAPEQNGQPDERDQLIASLQHDVVEARDGLSRLQGQAQSRLEQYENRISQLEHQLAAANDRLESQAEENERFREQTESLQNEKNQQTLTTSKLEETERKAQSADDKFRRMKDVYAKLREEHIGALKRVGETQSELEQSRAARHDAETTLRATQQQAALVEAERSRADEALRRSAADAQTVGEHSTQLQQRLGDAQQQLDARTAELEKARLSFESERDALVGDLQCARQTGDAAKRDAAALFAACCDRCSQAADDVEEVFDDAAHLTVTCTPEFVLCCTSSLREAFDLFKEVFEQSSGDGAANSRLLQVVVGFANFLFQSTLHGKATANAAPTNQVNGLIDASKECLAGAKQLWSALRSADGWAAVPARFDKLDEVLTTFERRFRDLLGRMGDVSSEELCDLLDNEMKHMDESIQVAAAKIQDMMAKAREADTGVRLEVNERILDACTALMQAVMLLVQQARQLQAEIVGQGRGTGSASDFYKRNHQWTEGLFSAAKAVGLGARVLVDAADRVVSGDGKFEELVAASHEVAASTAQLVVASRVKAERGSVKLAALGSAGKSVTAATANVVGTVKSGQETLHERDAFDFSHLSLHEAKRAEMNCQVRVLELETELGRERVRLGELRKRHYQTAGPAEGWDSSDQSKESTPSR